MEINIKSNRRLHVFILALIGIFLVVSYAFWLKKFPKTPNGFLEQKEYIELHGQLTIDKRPCPDLKSEYNIGYLVYSDTFKYRSDVSNARNKVYHCKDQGAQNSWMIIYNYPRKEFYLTSLSENKWFQETYFKITPLESFKCETSAKTCTSLGYKNELKCSLGNKVKCKTLQ